MAFAMNNKLAGKILLFLNIILLILAVGSSYYRFVVLEDYVVAYEGDCDPDFESCYYDCEDDEFNEYYYFSIIERQVKEIKALCGKDVTECDEAYECQPDVEFCTISFCDPMEDGEEACASNIDGL